jgi:photosystem II stability/assembly factor-like uncharacterized protein
MNNNWFTCTKTVGSLAIESDEDTARGHQHHRESIALAWLAALARAATLIGALTLAGSASAADEASGAWVNVTNNVGGDKWGAYGVTYMTAVPNSGAVITGVSECGLWLSTDNGGTWAKLAGSNIMKFRPGRIVFDPMNVDTFWVSGCYGDSPFKTTDGGKTFERLGSLSHSDGIAVDFTDPKRSTLLLGLHEQSQSLEMSNDQGKSWTKIGAKLPADSNHSSDPILIDAKTFIINTAGWKQKATLGIYRTEDAGESWTSVSTYGPAGQPLVASDGAIYWQRIWGGGLLKSTDKGKTWTQISNAIKDNPIELPGKILAGVADKQVLSSTDGGVTWIKVGPPIPFKPNSLIYSGKGHCFYAWALSDNMTKKQDSIVRLSVP